MDNIKTFNLLDMNKFLEIFGRTAAEDPLKVFNFVIEIEQFARFGFSKVTGLQSQTDVVEYREGGQNTTPQKSTGLTKFPNVTFERGQIFAAGYGDKDILNWYTQVFDVSAKKSKSAGTFRRDIDVVQFNKEGDEVMRWRLSNAWPSEYTPTSDFDALASDNSIEKMVIAHEGFLPIAS